MPEHILRESINQHIQKILSGEIKKESVIDWNQRYIGKSPQVQKNIVKRQELIMKSDILISKRFEMEARLHELNDEMCKEVKVEGLSHEKRPLFQLLLHAQKQWVEETPQVKDALAQMEKFKGYNEIAELVQKVENVIFEAYIVRLELDENITNMRDNLFSDEYNKRLEELAWKGIFLYDMDLPIYPLLDESVTDEDILDSLVMYNFFGVKDMFGKMLVEDKSTLPVKLQRKIEDLKGAIITLENGELRSSARNIFALLEGEHKDCASIWDDYFKLSADVRKGKERSEEISRIIQLMNLDYYQKMWNIVDQVYKSITSNSKDAFFNRNSIIHGDYDSDQMDITAYDVIKLFTLYCNLRIISCKLAEYSDMLENILLYWTTSVAQDLKKKKH